MKETIFLDLDGTVFDVSDRVFAVYKDILKKYNNKYLSKEKYLKLKKNKIPIKKILKKTGAEKINPIFKKEWERKIEDIKYLDLDKISPKRRLVLEDLKKNYKLNLVTLRNNSRKTLLQLKQKKINTLFDKILIISGKNCILKWKQKARLFRKIKYGHEAIIVGDTETDIMTGKYLKIKTVAVLSGMREKRLLKNCKPDYVIKDISYLKKILAKKNGK